MSVDACTDFVWFAVFWKHFVCDQRRQQSRTGNIQGCQVGAPGDWHCTSSVNSSTWCLEATRWLLHWGFSEILGNFVREFKGTPDILKSSVLFFLSRLLSGCERKFPHFPSTFIPTAWWSFFISNQFFFGCVFSPHNSTHITANYHVSLSTLSFPSISQIQWMR